jgi:hypothetical protein
MSKKKTARIIDKYRVIQNMGSAVEVPWEVKRMFPGQVTLEVIGNQISFGEDYVYLLEARAGIQFLVEQLGGKVVWED